MCMYVRVSYYIAVIYYIVLNWSALKRNILIGSLGGPNFLLRWKVVDFSDR